MFDLDRQLQVVHYPVSLAVSHSAWHDKVTVQTVQCVLYVYFPWDKYKKSHRNTDFIYYFLQFILIRNKSCKFMSDNLMNSKLNILLSGPCGASLLRMCRFIGLDSSMWLMIVTCCGLGFINKFRILWIKVFSEKLKKRKWQKIHQAQLFVR